MLLNSKCVLPASTDVITTHASHRTISVPSVYRLHPEVFIDILTFLEANDVCRMSLSCRPLRSICLVADNIVWRKLCLDVWRGKQGFSSFVERVDMALACQRSIATPNNVGSQLRGVPRNRGPHGENNSLQFSPDTTLRCIKASILPATTVTAVKRLPPVPPVSLQLPPPTVSSNNASHPSTRRRFWWELSPSEQARRLRRMLSQQQLDSDSTSSAATSDDEIGADSEIHDTSLVDLEQQLMHAEDMTSRHEWSSLVTWKFAYFMSLRESKRCNISTADLTSVKWKIAFRQIPDRCFPARFDTESGNLVTPINADGFPFQLSQQGAELNVHVFPVLRVSRNLDSSQQKDWGWSIRNYFVEISSEDVPAPHYLRFLRLYTCIRPP